MGQFGFISSTRKRPILFPSPFSHRRQAADTVFLSSSSLSPFFIFKENSRPAEGAQLRRSLAVQRAPQGAAGPQKLFPGKAWAAGHILKLPRRQRGAWSRASGCNSGHLARRWKAPALIPNSESHVSTLTPDAFAVAAATVYPTSRPLNPNGVHPLGSLSCSAIHQAGLRMGRRSGRGFQTKS